MQDGLLIWFHMIEELTGGDRAEARRLLDVPKTSRGRGSTASYGGMSSIA
jgi:hypothetical protein